MNQYHPMNGQNMPATVPQRMSQQALAKLNETGQQITTIIKDCLPVTAGNAADFTQSLAIAQGVHDLKMIFLQSPEIRQVVMSMANNRLGFVTDRTPAIVARNQRNGKYPNRPYNYEELVDPIIEGLLKGYRISNNEINIIAGQFYAAKNGNYRRILEHPGLTNFAYNNDPAVFSSDFKTARVKVWAVWKVGEDAFSVGVRPDDQLVLQIRVNAGMGDDAVLGKAHAKLFKRVLERLTGLSVPESTDVEIVVGDDVVERPSPLPTPGNGDSKQLDIYGEAQAAPTPQSPPQPDAQAAPALREKFVQLVIDNLGEEYVEAALADATRLRTAGNLGETEFFLKMLNFKQERDTWLSNLARRILADQPGTEEQSDQPNPSAATNGPGAQETAASEYTPPAPTGAEPPPPSTDRVTARYPELGNTPESQPDNFWHQKSNWINRRANPFLMLVRIGLGLPFEICTLAKQTGEVVDITGADQAAYEAELKKHPGAWGSLFTAHASVKVCVANKMSEKRSMGLLPEVFDQWHIQAQDLAAASSQPYEAEPDGQDSTAAEPETEPEVVEDEMTF
jgi:hypothetical protein